MVRAARERRPCHFRYRRQHFTARLETASVPADRGIVGTEMQVSQPDDGPMTIWLEN